MKLLNKNRFTIKDISKRKQLRNKKLIDFWIKIENEQEYNYICNKLTFCEFDGFSNNFDYILIDEDDIVMYYAKEEYEEFVIDTNTNYEVFAFKKNKTIKISDNSSSILGISNEFDNYIEFATHVALVLNNELIFKNEDDAISYVYSKFDAYDLDLSEELI